MGEKEPSASINREALELVYGADQAYDVWQAWVTAHACATKLYDLLGDKLPERVGDVALTPSDLVPFRMGEMISRLKFSDAVNAVPLFQPKDDTLHNSLHADGLNPQNADAVCWQESGRKVAERQAVMRLHPLRQLKSHIFASYEAEGKPQSQALGVFSRIVQVLKREGVWQIISDFENLPAANELADDKPALIEVSGAEDWEERIYFDCLVFAKRIGLQIAHPHSPHYKIQGVNKTLAEVFSGYCYAHGVPIADRPKYMPQSVMRFDKLSLPELRELLLDEVSFSGDAIGMVTTYSLRRFAGSMGLSVPRTGGFAQLAKTLAVALGSGGSPRNTSIGPIRTGPCTVFLERYKSLGSRGAQEVWGFDPDAFIALIERFDNKTVEAPPSVNRFARSVLTQFVQALRYLQKWEAATDAVKSDSLDSI